MADKKKCPSQALVKCPKCPVDSDPMLQSSLDRHLTRKHPASSNAEQPSSSNVPPTTRANVLPPGQSGIHSFFASTSGHTATASGIGTGTHSRSAAHGSNAEQTQNMRDVSAELERQLAPLNSHIFNENRQSRHLSIALAELPRQVAKAILELQAEQQNAHARTQPDDIFRNCTTFQEVCDASNLEYWPAEGSATCKCCSQYAHKARGNILSGHNTDTLGLFATVVNNREVLLKDFKKSVRRHLDSRCHSFSTEYAAQMSQENKEHMAVGLVVARCAYFTVREASSYLSLC
jgi:hypothetical protein